MAGHYANFANVSFSDYEFTITFARVDHEIDADEIPGVVVSRVNLSPKFMRELADALEDSWSKWATREGIKNLPEFGGESNAEPRRPPDAVVAVSRARRSSASSIANATPLPSAAIQPHRGMPGPTSSAAMKHDEQRRRQAAPELRVGDTSRPAAALVGHAEPDPLDRRRVGRREERDPVRRVGVGEVAQRDAAARRR